MSGALVLAGLLVAAGPTKPVASFDDLGVALTACIRGDAPAASLEVDLRFVLSARGALVGRPEIVSRTAAPMAAQRSLRAAMLDALRRCTPFDLAPDFARTIAGRSVTVRVFTGGRAVVV